MPICTRSENLAHSFGEWKSPLEKQKHWLRGRNSLFLISLLFSSLLLRNIFLDPTLWLGIQICQGAQDTLFLLVGLKLKARDEEMGQTWLLMAPSNSSYGKYSFSSSRCCGPLSSQPPPVESPCSSAVPTLQNMPHSFGDNHQMLISSCPGWAPSCFSL